MSRHFQRSIGMALIIKYFNHLPTNPSQLQFNSSIPRSGQTCEKRRVCGQLARHELREQPHALGLARLSLRKKPERPEQVQITSRCPHEKGIGIADETGQHGDPQSLTNRRDLRREIGSPDRHAGGLGLSRADPIRAPLARLWRSTG